MTAKYEWESTSFRDGIISFELYPVLNVKTEKVALSVDMPLKDIRPPLNAFDFEEAEDTLRVIFRALRPVLALPWSILTLSFNRHAQLQEHHMRNTHALFYLFFGALAPDSSKCCALRHIDRLVLDYGHSRLPAHAIDRVVDELSDFLGQFGSLFKEYFSREYTNACVSRLIAGKDKELH